MKIREFIKNFTFKTYLFALTSTVFTLIYSIYNLIIGIIYVDAFSISIFTYYFLLFIIRTIILTKELLIKNNENKKEIRKKYYKLSSVLMLIVDVSLIGPITLMIINPKEYDFGLTLAIATAFYTTLKVVFSIKNVLKSKRYDNIILRRLREINIVEAIVSILALQRILIMVNGGMDSDMFTLCCVDSFVIYIFIIVYSFLRVKKIKWYKRRLYFYIIYYKYLFVIIKSIRWGVLVIKKEIEKKFKIIETIKYMSLYSWLFWFNIFIKSW